jgi:hypothetical protein
MPPPSRCASAPSLGRDTAGNHDCSANPTKTSAQLTSIECLIRIVCSSVRGHFANSTVWGSILTFRKRLLTSLLLFSPAAGAQYTVFLHFPDHSIEVCASTGYSLDFVSVDIDVTSCKPDTIFSNGMGG